MVYLKFSCRIWRLNEVRRATAPTTSYLEYAHAVVYEKHNGSFFFFLLIHWEVPCELRVFNVQILSHVNFQFLSEREVSIEYPEIEITWDTTALVGYPCCYAAASSPFFSCLPFHCKVIKLRIPFPKAFHLLIAFYTEKGLTLGPFHQDSWVIVCETVIYNTAFGHGHWLDFDCMINVFQVYLMFFKWVTRII